MNVNIDPADIQYVIHALEYIKRSEAKRLKDKGLSAFHDNLRLRIARYERMINAFKEVG